MLSLIACEQAHVVAFMRMLAAEPLSEVSWCPGEENGAGKMKSDSSPRRCSALKY